VSLTAITGLLTVNIRILGYVYVIRTSLYTVCSQVQKEYRKLENIRVENISREKVSCENNFIVIRAGKENF